jgi:branched-subunit amino acid aminotransferase/4-amino-4-deoxychorismate lyase
MCVLTPEGIEPASYAASSFADAAAHDPLGVYTIGRTYQRDKVLLIDDHLDRLEESARLEQISVRLDRSALRKALRGLIAATDYPDSRFKITIPAADPTRLLLAIERYKPVPPEIVRDGARVVTVHLVRHNPGAKTSAWMHERQHTVQSFPVGIYEGILVTEDSVLLEGTSSNFYAVVGGTLRTAVEGVLEGISRRTLLKVAPDILPLDLRPVRLADRLDEAFLTSAGRGVVPIVEIDGQRIGSGRPGPLTRQLREAYEAWALANLEAL